MRSQLQKCTSQDDLVAVGSVIVDICSSDDVIIEVHLDDGAANAVLSVGVWLNSRFDAFFNILATNDQGKGNAQVTVPIPDGSDTPLKVEVWVFDDPFSEFCFTPSPPMRLPLK